jgi:hypothetical protein
VAANDGQTISPDLASSDVSGDVSGLFHRLNNQLGVILANAELLENRLGEEPHKLRAGQVVSCALEAIDTVRKIRTILP